jgi:type I restriction enzyme S subunit
VIQKGDFIISLRSFQGGIEYSKYTGICSPAYIVLRKKNVFDDMFFKHYFKTDLYIRNLNKNLEGIRDGKMVSYKQFSEILLPFPTIQEQQRIASCLSSLDEVIEAHNKKLELLKEHKKGLMQNLFPQEGEKVPKLRFKEFEKEGEWKEKKLSEVAEINPSTKELPQEFIYIDLESVENGVLKQKKQIHFENAPSRAQRLLKKRDIIFQMVRPYQKNNYHFFPSDNFDYVASTGYAQLRAFQSSEYLYQYLHTDIFVNKVLEKCTGSNYPAINSSDLSKLSVKISKNPKEQQKIASCLFSLDRAIEAQAEKIKQLELHKKGLMQSLFPKIKS